MTKISLLFSTWNHPESNDWWWHVWLHTHTHFDDSVCMFLSLQVELLQSLQHKSCLTLVVTTPRRELGSVSRRHHSSIQEARRSSQTQAEWMANKPVCESHCKKNMRRNITRSYSLSCSGWYPDHNSNAAFIWQTGDGSLRTPAGWNGENKQAVRQKGRTINVTVCCAADVFSLQDIEWKGINNTYVCF